MKWCKDANKDFMNTFGFQYKITGQIIPESLSHCCMFTLLANFNKRFPLQLKIPDRKSGTRAETARNDITKLQSVGYSTQLRRR